MAEDYNLPVEELAELWKVKKSEIFKMIRMGFSIVENLSGFSGSMFSLFRSPPFQFPYRIKKWSDFTGMFFSQIPPMGCPYSCSGPIHSGHTWQRGLKMAGHVPAAGRTASPIKKTYK